MIALQRKEGIEDLLKIQGINQILNVRSIASQILCMVLISLAGIASAGKIDDVRANVYAWSKSWQSRDIDSYMSFYSQDFRSDGLDYQGWKQKSEKLFKMPGDIRVDISDLCVFIEAEYATAIFLQRYQDPKISDVGEKTLTLVNSNGRWEIVSEMWKPLAMPGKITQKMPSGSRPEEQRKINAAARDVHETTQAPAMGTLSQDGIIVKSIKFESEKNRETVFIAANNFFVPEILTLEGDKPRIVIDIQPVSSWSGEARTPVNGNLIRQIRTFLHHDAKKLRVVLDLNPSENYYINQLFYKKENMYCLEVR